LFRLDRETISIPASDIDARVAVIIPARNEEKNIANSLESIINQELTPYKIIVINDGSSDNTEKIASSFDNVEVINIEKHESLLAKKELANTLNSGLAKLQEDKECQYVMLSGSDFIYPKNYLSTIITRMKSKSNIAVASGIISGEHYREPSGTGGRVVDVAFWKKIGFCYPVNYAFEGYLLWKAQSMGYDLAVYPDLIMETQRATGSEFKPQLYYNYGLGAKALGYIFPYFIYKIVFFARKKPKGAFYYLKGYLSNYNDLYEPELRKYVKSRQWYKIRNISSKDFKFFLNYLGLGKIIKNDVASTQK
jgi:glycosyltransferase involved in cell wall biosynthesis